MLVLTRKSEQKILIGKDIVITILRVYGDQVSIGIDAPKEMRIFREELVKDSVAETAPPVPVPTAEVELVSAEQNGAARLRKRLQKQTVTQEV
jgi:carbon storage regulator